MVSVVAGAVTVLVAATVALAGASTSGSIPNYSTSDLTKPAGNDWYSPQSNVYGQRYSSLTKVSPANVSKLTLAFHVKTTAPKAPKGQDPPGLFTSEAPTMEAGGTLFAEDAFGRVFAYNATTGKKLWTFEPHNPATPTPPASKIPNSLGVKLAGASLGASRGVALNNGIVYAFEEAGNVVAINADTGKLIWHTQVAPLLQGQGGSLAPLYADGVIYGATAAGDQGEAPCFAFAIDAKTGKMLWKFKVIPAKSSDPGYGTWAHPLPSEGGGAMWATPAYDPQLKLVYFATGNPIPYMGLLRGPGKEYFTDGLLALHSDTGKLAWFFQEVHHDVWDADQSQQPVLYDGKVEGKDAKALITADKDGLWYVLDRATGTPLIPVTEMKVQQSKSAHTYATQPIPATTPLVPQTVPDRKKWAHLKAPDGKPFNIGPGGPAGSFTAADATRYSVTAAFGQGASGNKPPALDPTKGILFEETTPGFFADKAIPKSETSKLSAFNFSAVADLKVAPLTGTPAAAVSGTRIEAMDIHSGKMIWKVDHLASQNKKSKAPGGKPAPSNSFNGGLAASNGILWASSGNALQAYDENTGKLLWSSKALPSPNFAPPMTYSVNGTQYVTIYLGITNDLYVFKLS
ncbi:MAG TPA: PQQ-binding-like beta-propeller repeat protein [Gaiellaceae bacterium]|nr:PQQ-binding-like beta-propeller repeat protein [Gaiellaceae bacterium]